MGIERDTIAEHTPSVYIPMDRRQALVRGSSLPDRTTGAALFADISGSTLLTEVLARTLGPRLGAEELTHQLNQVYDMLIAEVDRYGGSVIGFAGDAITCWFAEPDSSGSEKQELPRLPSVPSTLPSVAGQAAQNDSEGFLYAPLRATACALAMQQAMEQFAVVELPAGETVELAMKAAVASGAARRFLVGDPGIQLIDALAGETVARMAAAERLADRGEVVVDAQTAAYLGKQAQVVKWRTEIETGNRFAIVDKLMSPVESVGWPPLDPQALHEDQVRPWLLPAVYERLREGLGEILLELKPGVTLFLRFEGIDYDGDEAAEAKLDAYIRWVQGLLAQYEGSLLQLIIGDKGSYLYAAFGAPIAHEDDALRAVLAALELRTPPADMDFIHPVQIGISQGMVRAGAYGGTTRRTYGVLSDEVNLAARLMQHAAPGEVLVSRRVQKAVSEAFTWEILPAVRVKGKSRRIPMARLVGVGKAQVRAGSAAYTGPLVGREAELAQLVQFSQPLFEGKFVGMAYVYGEAGVGKSRLVYELRQLFTGVELLILDLGVQSGVGSRIFSNQATIEWFTCLAEQILRQSLNPFKYFLREYFDQYTDSPEEENKARFDEILGMLIADLQKPGFHEQSDEIVRELERTRSVLGALVDLHWEGSLYEQLEPKLRFENTLAAFKTLIMAESLRRPVILHIEDAHWLDADSQELLKVLTRNVETYPFAVLLTGRYRDDGSRFVVSVNEDVPQQAIDLNELPPADIQALAQQTLEGAIAGELAAFLMEKTNGNPLFVEQLVQDMRERALIQVENGEWRVERAGMEEVPASINAVMITRLDRLTARIKATVQTAAVLGHEFQVQVLSRMLRDDAQLAERIRQAEAQMIWSALSELRYIFRHTLMRDAAYEMQLRAHLQKLHALAGEAIEQVYASSDLGPHYADLAYHYGKAREDRQAFRYARLAGERAAAQFANHEAIDHLEAALQSAEHLAWGETFEERQEIHVALGRLLTNTAQYDHALDHLDKALELAIERGDPDAQARACRWSAEVYESRSEYASALEWVRRGLDALKDRDEHSTEAAELSLIAGLIHTRLGDYDSALDQCTSALNIAEQLNEVTTLARAYNLWGHTTRLMGQSGIAIEYFQRALSLYQRVGDIRGQALAHNQVAAACLYIGRLQEAEHQCRLAREIFNQIGDMYNLVFVNNNLGEVLLKQGNLDGALASYQEGLRTLEHIGGSAYVLGALHNNLGATYIRRGEIDAARQHLRVSRECFEQAQARDWLPELYRHWAKAALLAGELPDAETHVQQSLSLARELNMRDQEGNSLRVLGEIAAAQGQFKEAEAHLRQSLEILREVENEYEEACSQLALARLHAVQGKSAETLATLEQCIPTFERLEAALDLNTARELQKELDNDPS
jgi:adenylate cyclase